MSTGHATEQRHVYLTGRAALPGVTEAVAGDEVLFLWRGEEKHNITGLQGETFETGARADGDDYVLAYNGGIVRYRCLFHSRVSDAFVCTGMCGTVTDRPLDDAEPPQASLDRPAANSLVPSDVSSVSLNGIVEIGGRASDNDQVYGVVVRVYDTTGVGTEYRAACEGCGESGREASWSFLKSYPPGSYVAEAIAVDATGNVRISNRTNFFIL